MNRRLLIATAVGFALRFAWLLIVQPQPVSDYEYIRRFAESLIDHHQYGFPTLDSGRMPGMPFIVAALMSISRSVFWLSAAAVVLSSMLVPVVALFARRLGFSEKTTVVAAWIVACDPTFVFYGPLLASEHLLSLALIGALAVAAGIDRAKSPTLSAAGAGVLFGLAAMGRAEALVYAPVAVWLIWRRMNRPVVCVIALAVCAALTVAPWYIRNRVLIGPGAGLSTSGGPTFYYAHNDRWNGWFPLKGTPLEGLTQLQMQTRGYELGIDYIRRAGFSRLLKDAWIGTTRLYSPVSSPFSLRWSTMQAGAGPDDFTRRPIPGMRFLELVSGTYGLIALAAAASWLLRRHFPPGTFAVIWSLIAIHWITHGLVFLGESRYRYVAEILFCLLAAHVVTKVRAHRN